MSTYDMRLKPRDLLFMRDARPMEKSDAGIGANWPRPDHLWNALINAFHREWPEQQEWEGEPHTRGLEKDKKHANSSFRFSALRTIGPFPVQNGKVYFPCPMDLSSNEKGKLLPMKLVGAEGMNPIAPLTKMLQAQALGKTPNPIWLSKEDYIAYLKGENIEKPAPVSLYDAERNIGVAIDASTGTTKKHQLYQAEYLRLKPDVSIAFKTSCMLTPKGKDTQKDLFKHLDSSFDFIMGGQQSVVTMSKCEAFELPSVNPEWKQGMLLRWTLLTPLIAANGWLPAWIDKETGKVMLARKKSEVSRSSYKSRDAWRRDLMLEKLDVVTLVAARIGKPICFSGWDLQDGGPKSTILAVPAGSAYYFHCADEQSFKDLWKALSFNPENLAGCRSDQFGEKGFGLGVCSAVNENNN